MIITFPWRKIDVVEPDRTYTALFGLVRLQNILLLPTFLQYGIRIERQLQRSRGAVGYRTAADPMSLSFYHLSAWLDAAAIGDFVQSQPHSRAVEQLVGRLGATTFRYWDIIGSDLPLHIERELQNY